MYRHSASGRVLPEIAWIKALREAFGLGYAGAKTRFAKMVANGAFVQECFLPKGSKIK